MYCCVDCFQDSEVKNIISTNNQIGDCNFCGKKNEYIIDVNNTILHDMFDGLLNIYSVIPPKIRNKIPSSDLNIIKRLQNDWSVFNLSEKKALSLLRNICHDKVKSNPQLFTHPVYLPETQNESFLEEHSILYQSQWDSFVREIKQINRFHLHNNINLQCLDLLDKFFTRTIHKKKFFYRSRICMKNRKYPIKQMGAPPRDLNYAGRINPKGISVLYLSDEIKTAMLESRARKFDKVTIGKFITTKEMRVFSFLFLDKLSPFLLNDLITIYYVNKEILRKICTEIAKPLRRFDSDLDYLPTQYITEYLKKNGFDGIEYYSTIKNHGVNYGIFSQHKVECIKTDLYKIVDIDYHTHPTL